MKTKLTTLILVVILAIGFTIRLYKIHNPVADWHSWRQADTASVTRYFVKHGVDMLTPHYHDFSVVSVNGEFNPHGYRFVEFPIFNLIHYIFTVSLPFESLEFWGRLTSIIAALTSSVLIYFLTKRHADKATGLVASAVYLFIPYNIYFTRVILPDPLMVTFFLLTLNFFDLYASKKKLAYFLLTALFGGIAVSVKPVAIFFLLPITISMLRAQKLNALKNPHFYLLHLSFIAPFAIWRIRSNFHPEGIPASTWLINGTKIRWRPSFFNWIFNIRLARLILGGWGIWPFLSGIVSSSWYFLSLGFSALLYVFVFATGNVHHDYYQIPTIPAISIFVAVGSVYLWRQLNRKFLYRALLIICLAFGLRFSWIEVRGLYQINNGAIVNAGKAADKLLPENARVIAPYQGDTAFLYQTNREGFGFLYEPLKDMIDRFGITHYVSVTYDAKTREIMDKYTVITQTPEYVIVKLEEKLNNNP